MGARGKAEQGLEGRHRGAPPVETNGELVQVGLEVIVPDAVDVRQERGRPLGGALGPGAMPVAHVRQRRIRPPAIRQDEGAGRDGPLHESCQRASRCVRHNLEAHPTGGLTPHFDRAHNQRLLPPLAAPLQAYLRTAQVGFVDLGLVLERFSLGVDHGQP